MTRTNTTYTWRFPEARRTAVAAVEAALKGERAAHLQHEINLLRIHMVTPRSVESYERAQRRIEALRRMAGVLA